MARTPRLRFVSRTLTAVATAVAAAVLVVAHLASGPAVQAAADDLVVTGPDRDGSPHIRTFGPTGTFGGVEFTSAGAPNSGATVAVGDVTGDGAADIVTGSGPRTNAAVQVWNRAGTQLLAAVNPFPNFQGGVTVATATIDDVAGTEVIVGAGPGGGPHVRIYKFSGGQLVELGNFFAFDSGFSGGVNVGAAPGTIVAGAGAGGAPHVRVFGVTTAGVANRTAEWYAYAAAFNGGVRVALGEVDGDTGLEVVTGAGPGAAPHVRVFNSDGTATGPDFYAYAEAFKGGVWVATASGARNPGDRIITGAGPGGAPHVRGWAVTSTGIGEVASFYAYAEAFKGGVHVGGFPAASTGSTTTTTGGGSTTTGGGGGTTTTAGGGATTTTAPCNGTRLPNGTCVPVGGSGSTTTTTAA